MESPEPPEQPVGDPEDAVAAAAFHRLFGAHFEELYRFGYRYVQSAETAKDLVHEAFLRLWRQRAQVELGGSAARSYLYTIVRYQALDHLRRRRTEERWRREYVTPLLLNRGQPLAVGPDEEYTAREIAAAIRQAVEGLPRRQQQVLRLRWQQQASYDEIAKTLGISPKTVAIHVGKAIQRLREVLAQVR